MHTCPLCTAPVRVDECGSYQYLKPKPIDLEAIKLHAIQDFVRAVQARLQIRPSLGYARAVNDELVLVRRVLQTVNT